MATPLRQLTEWKRLAQATVGVLAVLRPQDSTDIPKAVIVLVDELMAAKARIVELEQRIEAEGLHLQVSAQPQ